MKLQYQYNDDKQILQKLQRCSKHWILYPELEDNTNRLHYHGIINNIHDKLKWHKQILPSFQKLGFIKIKPIKTFNDKLNWLTYCMKNFAITNQILKQSPLYPRHKIQYINLPQPAEGNILDYLLISKTPTR